MRRTTPLPLVVAAALAVTVVMILAASLSVRSAAAPPGPVGEQAGDGAAPEAVRFATFNASLNRGARGELVEDLSTPDHPQARNVAETIQRTRPDVLLVNEFDHDPAAVDLFRDNYLEVSQNGARPVHYPYAFIAPSNTGVASGHDLDNDGTIGGGNDAFGFGLFEGQYGMLVLSRHPIDTQGVRTFRHFLWQDMPGAMLPDDPATPEPADWYSPDELEVLRLSSKSHWDVPVETPGGTVHFLVSHPTPPVFDGEEDRNGTRNHDEIRFWADYVSADAADSAYVYDDRGRYGGLPAGADFVIAGDQNSDPLDGDSVPGSAQLLLDHPRVDEASTPTSPGGPWAARLQGGMNDGHESDPAYDTADFDDRRCCGPGNLRADYVLPSESLRITESGIFWPREGQKYYYLTGNFPFVPTSDHRLVWVDVRVR